VKLHHVFEYLAFLLISFFVQLLPLSGARWIGRRLGRLVFAALGYRRKVTLGNLRRAFPEKSEKELISIARGAYENAGISLFELVWFPRMTAAHLKSLIHFDKPEIVKNAYAEGTGLLLLTAHFGNWELLAQSIVVEFGFPVSFIVKRQANQFVDRRINKRRVWSGNKTIPMETALRGVLKALQNGEAVGLVADQAAPKENVPIEFFGTKVPTHQGPAVFALKMGAPLVTIFSVRRPDGSYDMVVERVPFEDLKGYTEENAVELTRRHVKITEDIIRRYPDHWLWMHKRWKHVPLENERAEASGS
jgi:Kdo2-lipid IVA lauroyltransferase/acyltransferase